MKRNLQQKKFHYQKTKRKKNDRINPELSTHLYAGGGTLVRAMEKFQNKLFLFNW
jgi:hypothetical protein